MNSSAKHVRSRRALRGEPLNCPRCQSQLVPRMEQEIEVDVCPLCQGVWLDRNELEQLLAAAIWEVDRYATKMSEVPSVAAAANQELMREDSEPEKSPSMGQVVSRFKDNFGHFLRRLKVTRPTR
ncbi:MAG: zf-TFIIB domain-containing protein [Planctomycetota bacterium]